MLLINVMRRFFLYLRFKKYKRKWRRINSNNYTVPKDIYPDELIQIGNYSYGEINVDYYSVSNEKLLIGHFCSIAQGVLFILGGGHNYRHFTNYPFDKKFNDIHEALTKGPIIVHDDVWIGYGATILSGVELGQGAVIGARAVVTKSVPPYAIVVGNPAVIIKYRFPKDICERLLSIDFSLIDDKKIHNLYSKYNVEVNTEMLQDILNIVSDNI